MSTPRGKLLRYPDQQGVCMGSRALAYSRRHATPGVPIP